MIFEREKPYNDLLIIITQIYDHGDLNLGG
jgi:hypothetical protein